jgi:hypothetical protein
VLLHQEKLVKVTHRKLGVGFRVYRNRRAYVEEDFPNHIRRVVHAELMEDAGASVAAQT